VHIRLRAYVDVFKYAFLVKIKKCDISTVSLSMGISTYLPYLTYMPTYLSSHLSMYRKVCTPLKFNMEPEKKSLEKEIPFGNHHFQVPC